MNDRLPSPGVANVQYSEVEHRILERRPCDASTPGLLCFPVDGLLRSARGGGAAVAVALQQFVDVRAAALARKIRIVRGRDEAHSLGRASKEVARSVGERLQLVRLEANVVVYDVVVRRARGSLESAVRCEEGSQFLSRRCRLNLHYLAGRNQSCIRR